MFCVQEIVSRINVEEIDSMCKLLHFIRDTRFNTAAVTAKVYKTIFITTGALL